MKPDEIGAFLREPLIADLATLRPDGSPHVAPVWFHYDGQSLKVVSEKKSVKVRNIRHDPRVSVSIPTPSEPYKYVLFDGTATVSLDEIPELTRSMAVRYMGQVQGERYAERVLQELDFCLITVTPSKILGWSDEE